MSTRPVRPRGQRGSMTLELVVVFAGVMLLLFFAFAAGRILTEKDATSNAAQDGARAASISRDPGSAQTNGRNAALADLNHSGLHCQQPVDITVNTQDFSVPIGDNPNPDNPLTVTVTVTCVESMADLIAPGFPIPGNHIETFSFTSVIDQYRER